MIDNGASILSSVVFVRLDGNSFSCTFTLVDRFADFEPRAVLRRIKFLSNDRLID